MIPASGIAFSSEYSVPVAKNRKPSRLFEGSCQSQIEFAGLGGTYAQRGVYVCILYGSKGKASPAHSHRYVCVHIAAFLCKFEVGRTCVSNRCFCERRTHGGSSTRTSQSGLSLVVTRGPLLSTQHAKHSRSKIELDFIVVNHSMSQYSFKV